MSLKSPPVLFHTTDLLLVDALRVPAQALGVDPGFLNGLLRRPLSEHERPPEQLLRLAVGQPVQVGGRRAGRGCDRLRMRRPVGRRLGRRLLGHLLPGGQRRRRNVLGRFNRDGSGWRLGQFRTRRGPRLTCLCRARLCGGRVGCGTALRLELALKLTDLVEQAPKLGLDLVEEAIHLVLVVATAHSGRPEDLVPHVLRRERHVSSLLAITVLADQCLRPVPRRTTRGGAHGKSCRALVGVTRGYS